MTISTMLSFRVAQSEPLSSHGHTGDLSRSDDHVEFVERIAREAAGEWNAWQYLDDLIQEGFQKLAEITSGDPQKLPFCRKRIKGAMFDWLRKENRHQHGEVVEIPDEVKTVEQQLKDHQRKQRLKAALIEMPRRDRDLLKRRYEDGLTQQQIAQELHVSQQSIAKRERRLLRTIRPYVEVALAA